MILESTKLKHLRVYCLPLAFLILIILGSACREERALPKQEKRPELSIKRFDRAFYQSDTALFQQELAQLKQDFPPFFASPNEALFWRRQREDSLQNALFSASEEVHGSLSALETELAEMLQRWYPFSQVTQPYQFYSYISGLDFQYPILVADSLCFIALDLYLGPDRPYYAALPLYLQELRHPRYLLRDITVALVESAMAPLPREASLIDYMLYHGRKLYLSSLLLPQLSEADLLRYSEEELAFCRAHEREMWVYFVENELLYQSNTELERRFINPAPFSKFRTPLDRDTPGMIGRWFGLQIVRAHYEKEGQALRSLLEKSPEARRFLRLSQYKP